MERQDTVKYLSKKCFNGKNVLNPYTGQMMYQPCGVCPACLTRISSARSMRVSLQASISKYSYMISLSYNTTYVPKYKIRKVSEDPDDHSYVLYTLPRKKGDYKINKQVVWKSKLTGKKHVSIKKIDAPLTYNDDFEVSFSADPEYMKKFTRKASLNVKGKYPHLQDTYGYICQNDVVLFMKRLRKYLFKKTGSYEKIHSYVVSEYGPLHFRPHFHIILCFDSDKVAQDLIKAVRACWPFGTSVSFRSDGGAESYVAAYVNSFSRLPYHLREDSNLRPRGRFSVGFTKGYFSDALQAIRDSISRPKEEAPFSPFLNGIPALINGKLLSVRPPRSCVDSCFLRYASDGRLSSHELYWLVRSVSNTLWKVSQWYKTSYGPGRRFTLMDAARQLIEALFYHSRPLCIEKYFSIKNDLYVCFNYARIECIVSHCRDNKMFDRDVGRLYRLFLTVCRFTKFWNLTRNTPYNFFIRVIDLSRYYYSCFAAYNLRSQYLELSSLVDLDEDLALFSVLPIVEDGGFSSKPFECLIESHSIVQEALSLAKQYSDERVKHREINDLNIEFVRPGYYVS